MLVSGCVFSNGGSEAVAACAIAIGIFFLLLVLSCARALDGEYWNTRHHDLCSSYESGRARNLLAELTSARSLAPRDPVFAHFIVRLASADAILSGSLSRVKVEAGLFLGTV